MPSHQTSRPIQPTLARRKASRFSGTSLSVVCLIAAFPIYSTIIGADTGAGASVCAEAAKAGDALPDARADTDASKASGDIVSTDDSSDIPG